MPFLDSLDIANSVCQHIGAPRILDIDEDSNANSEIAFAYDKLRQAELRRNLWKFATRRVVLRAIDSDSMLLNPDQWDTDVTYLLGSLVRDENGLLWASTVPANLGNEPHVTAAWESYFGPMTATLYDSTIAYFAGELVYKEAGNAGGYVVFISLENDNDSVPSTTDAWVSTTVYRMDDVVSHSGSNWRSLIEVNTGITPAEGPTSWDENATYAISDTVTGSDGFKYTATGTTTGDDPTTDGGVNWTNSGVATAWTAVPTLYSAATSWRPLFAALTDIRFTYPVGCGPASQGSTRNVFRLPSGYLREAPQSPKQGSHSPLGGPGYRAYEDWEYEGNYLISSDAGPLLYRFIADITEVKDMDSLFCEGLAARIGLSVCETITQSGSKLKDIAGKYKTFMTEARMVNAIEAGSIEPPEDILISCRL